ncbi:MAG: citrate lyase subunit alpha [Acidaminococcaceae bacterium]|nr:citrate lyase subunit alpha [Acidaminococcaceae bacterium]
MKDELTFLQKYKEFNNKTWYEAQVEIPKQPLLQTRQTANTEGKVLASLSKAIDAVELRNGMTVSFHHALRNGDLVMQMVFAAIHEKGIKNLTLSASSLSLVQDVLFPYFEDGTITAVDTSGARGKLATWIQAGKLSKPAIFRTHGGRARAISTGELKIDVAFLAAPCCDTLGNVNGVDGKAACGSLGYAMVDAAYAKTVVAVTDNLVNKPLEYVSIPAKQVDYIVEVPSIGNPAGIATGSIRPSKSPVERLIAHYAAQVIANSSFFKTGISFQFGSGGIAISTAKAIRTEMEQRKIVASSAVGGMTGVLIEMLQDGLIDKVYDPQTFDTSIIHIMKENPNYHEISASDYANPFVPAPAVDLLDVAVLSATEMDVDFNVNVLTNSYGKLIGAPGGHPDAAAGAKLSIVTMPLLRGRLPMLLDRVNTIVTPGNTIDVLVTEYGIAINPLRQDLVDHYRRLAVPQYHVDELQAKAYKLVGKPQDNTFGNIIGGVVEYRDGRIIDVVRNVK